MWSTSVSPTKGSSSGTNSDTGAKTMLDELMGRHTLAETNAPPNHVTPSHSNNSSNNNSNNKSNNNRTTQSSSSSSAAASAAAQQRKDLPPLFWFMETGDWEKAVERIHRHPREVKTWATMRTKTTTAGTSAADDPLHTPPPTNATTTTTTKRLALHHACFKLRAAGATMPQSKNDTFVEVCRFILLLIKLYPEAAQKRETRHGCLPLHLAAFASCAPRESDDAQQQQQQQHPNSTESLLGSRPVGAMRQSSDSTNDTNMSAVHAEERYMGAMSDGMMKLNTGSSNHNKTVHNAVPNVSVSMRTNTTTAATATTNSNNSGYYSAKREEMLVQVIDALLDAYPKAARVDSEGGRLPLHTACAGRATPRVISTLITAYPAAARQRNKDGFLPLHLSAHWGVSHIAVAVQLLKVYPDATVGRNRWERTPLEEALCMAGENGRPHQAALVRALRKHPSWWTRPQSDFRLTATNPRLTSSPTAAGARQQQINKPVSTIIDIDESLPSNDSTFDEQVRMHQKGIQNNHHHNRHNNNAGVDGGDEENDGKDDEMVSYDFGVEEIDLPPSPPTVSPTNGLMSRISPMTLLGKGKIGKGGYIDTQQQSSIDPLAVGVSLANLIERRLWNNVVARVRQNPLEAEQELQVLTRGGFMASTGMSPLHYACERRPPPEVVQILIESFPVATLTRAMPGGCLPLHIACTWHSSPEVITVLLAADSGSVRVKDELGNVPLHSACFSGADSRVIEALLLSDGKSVLARNHQGSRPYDICKRLRHENRRIVMDMLTRKKEEILRSHNRDGSSGMLADMAREAEEMNQRNGLPSPQLNQADYSGDLNEQHGGVEVTYDEQGNGQDELLWI